MMKWFLAFVVLAVASNALVLTRQGALDVTDDVSSGDADADVQGVLDVLNKVEAAQDREVSAIQTYASSKSDLLGNSLAYLQATKKDVETNMATLHEERKAIAAKMAPVAAAIKKLTAGIATLSTQLASAEADVSRHSVSTMDVSFLAKSTRITRRDTPTNSSSTSKKKAVMDLMKRLLSVLKALKARNPSPAEASNVLSKLKLASLIQSHSSHKPLKLGSFIENSEEPEDDPETLKTLVVVKSIMDEAARRCKDHQEKYGTKLNSKEAEEVVKEALSGAVDQVEAMIGTMQDSGVDAAQDLSMHKANSNEGAVRQHEDGTLVIKPAAPVDPGSAENASSEKVAQTQAQVSAEAQNIQHNLDLIAQETQKAVEEKKRVEMLKVEIVRRDTLLTRLEKFNAAKDKNEAILQANREEVTKRGQVIRTLMDKEKRVAAVITALTTLQSTLATNAQKRVQTVQDEKAGVDQVVAQVQTGPTDAPISEYGGSVKEDIDADLTQLLSPDSAAPTVPPADQSPADNLSSLLGDDAVLLG